MGEDYQAEIAELAADRLSGALGLTGRALQVLMRAAAQSRPDAIAAAGALCRAQPSMGSIWNAAVAAVQPDGPERLARMAERARRAPHALGRFAVRVLGGETGRTSRIATCSASASVQACLAALQTEGPVKVVCAEGRPLYEGRQMAADLARAGLRVELVTDAACGAILPECEAVLVGADAIANEWCVNKAGTRQLTAAAVDLGVPVFVAATREKCVHPLLAPHLALTEAPPDSVWDEPPAGVVVRNPVFERVPLRLLAGVISDIGLLGEADLPGVCSALCTTSQVELFLQVVRP